MNTALASTFERDFAAALLADAGAPGPAAMAALQAQPGFAIYRNTVHKGCIDALEANFPSVLRLVGVDWFRAAAAQHLRAHPPTDACLLRYGEGFAQTLAALAGDDWPYLAGVAMLDALWTATHIAADAPVLPADALAALAPQALARTRLQPHPTAHWQHFAQWPIHSIWWANRSGDPGLLAALPALTWQGEGTLLLRVDDAVQAGPLDAAGCALLDACAQGLCLEDAATAVLQAHPQCDLAALLAQLLRAGAFRDSSHTLEASLMP
ncbi:DNA-binding domain-containing protein [Xenophilus arseniciresistens]|uniref:DNA-binding domain-containing protein n=1 Tax=Xenophilus arseniciresistens TaxID=1283306 RepID=A0AAE3NBV0_9BURK|nr:DNA-binding domain-containing protein [Xenophilus arseniciresistens]MDA7417986.1 DNA-binding domain-containing protein [Xenophilus arseniciresistens]